MRRNACLGALAGLAFLLTFACGAASPAPAAPITIVVGEADAGTTVQARIGDTVRVKLQEAFPVPGSGIVWTVTSSAPSVLSAGPVTRTPSERPVVGQVTYTADFGAVAGGQAELVAHGVTSCEAMAKQYCPDRGFTITVTVS